MRRSGRRNKSPLGVSLFPFLAVLLCTMGSLIVLLICLVQEADLSAGPPEVVETAPVSAPIDNSELANAVDDVEFLAAQLKQKRDQYAESLTSLSDQMGIAERLLREQEDQAKLLQAQLVAIKEGNANEDSLEAAKEHAETIRQQIEELEKKLSDAKKQATTSSGRVLIVPYQGKNGTMQRPIYVECLRDRVVIQPEGIEFTSDDFLAARSAGNPLDASLRAVREYYAQKKQESGEESPYPLFVVRPGGDMSFLAARMAIVSWEDEFGYELIDDTLKLEYPPADPRLASLLERAAGDARKRQEALARALPGRFKTAQGSGGGNGGASAARGRGEGFGSGDRAGSGSFAAAGQNSSGAPASVGGNDARYTDGVAPKNGGTSKEASDKEGEAQKHGRPIAHGSKKPGQKDGEPGGEGGAPPMLEIEKRGKNWANKAADSIEVPVARTISSRCSAKEIVFLPPRGSTGKPIAISFDDRPLDVVDSIALQVRNRIESWGVAIGGGYWQPVLSVEVAPGGEARFEELATYFADSGIEVRRKR